MSKCVATEYARDIVSGKIPSSKYARLSCQRFLDDFKRDDIYFDKEAAERFYKFCTYMRHYKGPMSGQPLELEPWQKFIFANIYGWKKTTDDTWRFNYAYIEVPRKNGKTTMCAAGSLYDAGFIDGEGAEVYCAATKEDQAKLLVNDSIAFIKRSDELSDEFEFLSGKYSIFKRSSGRTSFVKPLGSDSTSLDGLNPLAVYGDELHAWKHRALWDVLEDAFGARVNWHMISITTAGYNQEGICYQERKHLCDILEGTIECDNKFGIIHTVDGEPHEADWEDESQWIAANPNLGTGKTIEFMRGQAEKSRAQPSKLTTFLNKQLNIWTDAEEIWIPAHKWDACSGSFNIDDMSGKHCYIGLDLARVRDLSAVAYFFPKQPGVPKARTLVRFFVPDEDVHERSKNDRVPYDAWERKECLIMTPGVATDYDFIKADILATLEKVKCKKLLYDRHFAGELINSLEKEGVTTEGFGMGFVSMSAPMGELDRMITSEEIEHDGNPVLKWNVSNTVIRTDPAGNIKPDKEKSIEKIDGVVALATAIGGWLHDRDEERESPYEKSPMRFIDLTPESKKRLPRVR